MRKKDHPMRKKDQEIFRRAVELAGSGKCKDWYDVQERLVEKGYRRAPDLLDGEKIRAILDSSAAKAAARTTARCLAADFAITFERFSLVLDAP
jgi:adenylylsulfate kinase-like enzyme